MTNRQKCLPNNYWTLAMEKFQLTLPLILFRFHVKKNHENVFPNIDENYKNPVWLNERAIFGSKK